MSVSISSSSIVVNIDHCRIYDTNNVHSIPIQKSIVDSRNNKDLSTNQFEMIAFNGDNIEHKWNCSKIDHFITDTIDSIGIINRLSSITNRIIDPITLSINYSSDINNLSYWHLLRIFHYLSARDIINCQHVCKRWHFLINIDSINFPILTIARQTMISYNLSCKSNRYADICLYKGLSMMRQPIKTFSSMFEFLAEPSLILRQFSGTLSFSAGIIVSRYIPEIRCALRSRHFTPSAIRFQKDCQLYDLNEDELFEFVHQFDLHLAELYIDSKFAPLIYDRSLKIFENSNISRLEITTLSCITYNGIIDAVEQWMWKPARSIRLRVNIALDEQYYLKLLVDEWNENMDYRSQHIIDSHSIRFVHPDNLLPIVDTDQSSTSISHGVLDYRLFIVVFEHSFVTAKAYMLSTNNNDNGRQYDDDNEEMDGFD